MKVSIILPTFNRADTLGAAAQSVLEQDLPPDTRLDLLIVDDGSTDDIAAVAARLADPRVRVVRLPKNRGAAIARNAGLAATRDADVVGFHDSDDTWLPGRLVQQLRLLADTGAAWTYGDMVRVGGDEAVPHPAPEVTTGRIANNAGDYQVRNIGIQTCLLRRAVIDAVGDFDEAFPRFIDLEWLTRVARDHPAARLPVPVVAYQDATPGSISSRPGAAAEARELLLRRHRREATPGSYRGVQAAEIGRQWARAGRVGRATRWLVAATLRSPRRAAPGWLALGAAIKRRLGGGKP